MFPRPEFFILVTEISARKLTIPKYAFPSFLIYSFDNDDNEVVQTSCCFGIVNFLAEMFI